MRYDTPMTPQGQEMLNLSTRQQIARGFKDMGKSSWSSAKNFGMIGALFSGTECTIEAVCKIWSHIVNQTALSEDKSS